jgi:hypothetical protein
MYFSLIGSVRRKFMSLFHPDKLERFPQSF